MYDVICKNDVIEMLKTCTSIIVCDDAQLTEEIRQEFPDLYVKPLAMTKASVFPNATYILTYAENADNVISELPNGHVSLVKEIESSELLDNFLDSIDFEQNVEEAVETEVSSDAVGITESELDSLIESVAIQEEQKPDLAEEEEPEMVVIEETEDLPVEETQSPTVEAVAESLEEEWAEEPNKLYEDREFDTIAALLSVLTPDMRIIAKEDMALRVQEARPDVTVDKMETGGISHTGGAIVLLRSRSKVYRREARKIYPPTATLFTVTC